MSKITNEMRYKTAEEETVMLKGDNTGLKETNKLLSVENNRLRGENKQLKARLEAVVKKCNDVKWADNNYATVDAMTAATAHNKDINAILRAARGEGGAE